MNELIKRYSQYNTYYKKINSVRYLIDEGNKIIKLGKKFYDYGIKAGSLLDYKNELLILRQLYSEIKPENVKVELSPLYHTILEMCDFAFGVKGYSDSIKEYL